MINNVNFSALSMERLRNRNISEQGISNFSDILQQAKTSDKSAKQFLSELSSEQLKLVQKANGLADKINITTLSTEGAQNLLSQPDGTDRVDLNNDGFVEVGVAKTIQFPPVNAPQHIKNAWDKATEGLSEIDKATLELSLHITVYGVNIEGVEKPQPLHPSQQWSAQGLNGFFNDLYGNLEFRVGREGWTDYNKMLERVYQTFEQEIAKTDPNYKIADRQRESSSSDTPMPGDKQSRLTVINQLLLDARLGLDREKLEEIDAKMEEIANDPSLTNEEKKELLLALQEQKEKLIQEAQKPDHEDKKRRAALSTSERVGEDIQILQLKNQVQKAWQLS